MSYVLHLWQQPLPATLSEAGEICRRLGAQQVAQPPVFLELARRLTARFPCVTTLDDDEDGDGDDAVWSDGPLDGRSDHPVYSVGLQSAAPGRGLPWVVETARALVHLPDDGTAPVR